MPWRKRLEMRAKVISRRMMLGHGLVLGVIAGIMMIAVHRAIFEVSEQRAFARALAAAERQPVRLLECGRAAHELGVVPLGGPVAARLEDFDRCLAALERGRRRVDQVARDNSGAFGEVEAAYRRNTAFYKELDGFIASGRELLARAENGELGAFQREIRSLALLEGGQLTERSEEALRNWHEAADKSVSEFRALEWSLLAIAFALLLAEGLLSFRPLVKTMASRTVALEHSNAELSELSYRLSHDLKSPLVSSIGLVDTLSTIANPEEHTKAVQLVSQSLRKLERLIDDILELTRSKLGEIKLEPLDFAAIVAQARMGLLSLKGVEKIAFRINILVQDEVISSRVLVTQIIENLVTNAVKYSDLRRPEPFVEIQIVQENELVRIRVTDNGIGVPEDKRGRLFQMFQRIHPKVAYGSGLGLYLVMQNAVRLHGTALYEPRPEGSSFVVILPIKGRK